MTNITTITPPSPALSDCDSLADIEDLDAFLNAQGPLSLFPTPGLEERSQQTSYFDFDHGQAMAPRTPSISVYEDPSMGADSDSSPTLIRSLLARSGLPDEIGAIALLILARLASAEELDRMPVHASELFTISALALSEIHVSDHPHRTSFWARMVSWHTTAWQIDAAIMEVFERMDWSIHALCHPAAVQKGVALLRTGDRMDLIPKLRIESACPTMWINGQITPANSSPPTAVERPTYFLPLL